ncbi:MAG: hypothetical protein EBT03_07365 [Betaproteobacteria bacterium]|nr:hypothetical protein [Betaproteobacteria bacterium]NCA16488.1 hypothetical protein [Betaproteobacteria bacterium]
MNKKPFRITDPIRRVQPESGQPIGWLDSLKAQIVRLQNEVKGVEARAKRAMPDNSEPAAVVAKKTFEPFGPVFNFDYKQDGVSSVQSQMVLQDGVTYEIPVTFPPPGLFVARFVKVALYQRIFDPTYGPMQLPVTYGNYFTDNENQTSKFCFPDNATITTRIRSRRISFLWNLIDTKSGVRLSDELLPDLTLLPQDVLEGSTGNYLELAVPWLFERDAQLTFLFRPITPAIQPTATSGYFPYSFDDREQNNTSRNMAITVQLELHGTRFLTVQDAFRRGADVP